MIHIWQKKKANLEVESNRTQQKQLFRNTKNVYVFRDQNEIIGMLNCRPEDKITLNSIMIFNVCLKKDRQRQGFGKQLMQVAINKCSQDDKDLTLTVYKDDSYVIKFYKKLNFEIISDLSEWEEQFPYFNKYLMRFKKTAKEP